MEKIGQVRGQVSDERRSGPSPSAEGRDQLIKINAL